MERFHFTTKTPFDHVERALDILRKMGFELHKLVVEAREQAFCVVVEFRQRGPLATHVFENRVLQFTGIERCEPGERVLPSDADVAIFREGPSLATG